MLNVQLNKPDPILFQTQYKDQLSDKYGIKIISFNDTPNLKIIKQPFEFNNLSTFAIKFGMLKSHFGVEVNMAMMLKKRYAFGITDKFVCYLDTKTPLKSLIGIIYVDDVDKFKQVFNYKSMVRKSAYIHCKRIINEISNIHNTVNMIISYNRRTIDLGYILEDVSYLNHEQLLRLFINNYSIDLKISEANQQKLINKFKQNYPIEIWRNQ